MNSICKFMPVKDYGGNIKAVNFVFEAEFKKLPQPFFNPIHRIHLMNGWAGIGYHFYIRTDGMIYQGRLIDTIGAHTSGYNSQCLGVCCEGNFEKQQMTPEQLKSAQWLKDYLSGIYPKAIHKRHKDVNATACPGRYFPFEEIKKGVQEMTLDKAIEIIKSKSGLEQQTIDFMLCYKYGEELITKLEAFSKNLGNRKTTLKAKENIEKFS